MRVPAILSAAAITGIAFSLPLPDASLPTQAERRSRLRGEHRAGRLHRRNNHHAGPLVARENEVEHDSNWAGAVLTSPPPGETFNIVSGQFTVPTPSVPPGADPNGSYSASIWVGIDGDTTSSSHGIWQGGIDINTTGGIITCTGWYEWLPELMVYIDDFTCNPGDEISLIIQATSPETGAMYIQNLSTDKKFYTETGTAPSPDAALVGQNVEWIVEDFTASDELTPFIDFGEVKFTNAVALTESRAVGPENAKLLEIVDGQQKLTTKVTLPSPFEVNIAHL